MNKGETADAGLALVCYGAPSISAFCVEFCLVLLLDPQPANYGDAILIEKEQRACIALR